MLLVNSVFVQTQTNPPCYHTLQIRPRLRAGFRSHVTSPGQIHSLRARDLKLGNILLSSPCGTRTYPDHNLLQMKKKHKEQKTTKMLLSCLGIWFWTGFGLTTVFAIFLYYQQAQTIVGTVKRGRAWLYIATSMQSMRQEGKY